MLTSSIDLAVKTSQPHNFKKRIRNFSEIIGRQKYKLNANSKYCHNGYFFGCAPVAIQNIRIIYNFTATGSGSRHSLFCLLPSRTSGNKQKELKQMSPSLTETRTS